MPRREDLQHVLVIGSGPILIGQAAEFDYSGTQACRVLREEGLRVTLINSNPATIMTDPEFADATYVEPITPEFVAKIIEKERPDALLATLGGQTALNTALALHESGVLERYGVELIGADVDAIRRGEDRQMFKDIVEQIGGESARSLVCHTLDETLAGVQSLGGYPVVVRPSFTMGGAGGGIAYDEADLRRIAGGGLQASITTEVLLEESILGWKEYELELMRDRNDNVVVICSIENLDPMGVHTGDSITVAPAMTLTDREYQRMRDLAIDVIRAVGVDTGGCNIQFAVEPGTGRLVVIEMNPRVSRSSALASKATGFPIAKIAAKLAVGYTLDEIPNDITRETPASFEPSLDYVVVKVPRFAFEKFPGADRTLTTHMKSVGEAMAMGRSFVEALQKALRSLEATPSAFWVEPDPTDDVEQALALAAVPTDGRLHAVELALRLGASPERVHEATGIDPWFVDQLLSLVELRRELEAEELDEELLRARQARGLQRQAAGGGHRTHRARGPRPAARARRAAGLQDGRHLRRRVRRSDAVPLLVLRRGDRGRPERPRQGAHPRQRPQPHRAGHRVRLRLRPRRLRAARRRLRDGDGQLQPRDRLHRLRHQRPALLRAADRRGRARGRRTPSSSRPSRAAAAWSASSCSSAGRRRCG